MHSFLYDTVFELFQFTIFYTSRDTSEGHLFNNSSNAFAPDAMMSNRCYAIVFYNGELDKEYSCLVDCRNIYSK